MIMQLLWCVALMACECLGMNQIQEQFHGSQGEHASIVVQDCTCTLNGALGVLMHAVVECDALMVRVLERVNDNHLKNQILSLKQLSTREIANLMDCINDWDMSEKLKQIDATLCTLYQARDVMHGIIKIVDFEKEFLEITSHHEDYKVCEETEEDTFDYPLASSGLFL